MKRFSVLSVDSPGSQENSNVSFPNKKLCAQNSTESPFPSRIQALAAVGATTQQHQNSSLQHPSSDGYLQQLLSSQLTRTLPVGENLTNFDFLRLGNSEDKTARQNGISNISDNFAQGQLALVNSIPMPLRNNMTAVYHNPLSIDLNPIQFSLNNNTNLQGQRWVLESNPQNNFLSQKERQANLAMDSIKSNSIDKLYGQIKKEEADYCPQSFADEMELRISELIFSQNKMLTDFKEKNHLVQDSLKVALDEIKGLNQVIKRQNPFATNKPLSDPLGTHQTIVNTNDVASSEVLITYLCGPNTDFEYNLILKSELQLPLYRERNFKFTVVLTDKQGNLVQNLEEFPLTLSIYNSENPPKSIETNNSGNKVLKGVNVKSMINGVASFEKIQIKEVTSHLRNGWIFIVVQPMILQNEKTNPRPLSSNRGKQPVDIKKIKPLVIDKIVVKAKKLKEKDPSEDNDDN